MEYGSAYSMVEVDEKQARQAGKNSDDRHDHQHFNQC